MAREVLIKSPDSKRKNRTPPNQRLTEDWPVLHYGSVPSLDASNWSLRMFGLVDEERKLTYREFVSLPAVAVFSDIHCVTGWSRLDNTWEGVSTSPLRDLCKILPEAGYVVLHSAGGYTTNLPIDEFFESDVLFALKHNGEPLTPEHGWPVRLVVPRLYFWKSAKWVVGVEFVKEDRPGFWETRGYHNHGDPWTEERYSDASPSGMI